MTANSSDPQVGWRLGYVVYSPDTDEYLASVADEGQVNKLAWCEFPDEALRWEDIAAAEAAAHARAEAQEEPGNRQYQIYVAELLDNGDRLTARTAAQIVPRGKQVLSPTEVMALGFSRDFRPTADRLGIRASHARSAVQRPDRVTHFLLADATLYIRKVAGIQPERHLLVVIGMDSASPEIIAAWPVPGTMVGPDPFPFGALTALCTHFGDPLAFRGGNTNLVLGERHPEVPRDLSSVISEAAPSNGVFQIRATRDPDTGELLIGWAYSLDDDRLQAALNDSSRTH